jgi:outer membrane receptor protein involved in Fe transport
MLGGMNMTKASEYSSRVRNQVLLGAATLALGLSSGAHAQEGPEPAASEGDIIVTAQKREERLLDVPMAITALTGEEIVRRGASSLLDLQYSVPGLSLVEQGPGQQRIQIRGISNSNGLPTVGLYLDEVPISIDDLSQNLSPRFIDMKQVEILRGPQGTLYGEGSMGGTIRFLTADPDLTRFGGSVEGQAGSVADGNTAWRVNGVVNLPLVTDRLGVRLVAGYENTGGWIDSTITGRKDVNQAKILTLRGKILARFSEDLQLSIMAQHQEQTQDYQNFGNDRKTAARVAARNNPNYDLVNAVLRWDLGGASLVNSLGYQSAKNDTAVDYSAIFVPILPFFGIPAGSITSVGLGSTSNIDVWTDELRLASDPGGTFDWSVGLYGRKLDREGTSKTFTAPGTAPFTLLSVSATQKSKAWAAFGEVNWNATEQLIATVGLRYFNENRIFRGVSTSFGASSPQTNRGEFSSVNPRFNLSYKILPTAMVYASAAKGFRSGGFNSAATMGPSTYDSENLWTYELGTKQEWFDRRLTLEAAVYYNEWDGVQTSVFATGASIGYIANTGKVNGWGADVSLSARPVTGMTLSATYGWNNLKYKSTSAEHLPGDPVDYAVRESWSGSFDYRRPLFGDVQGFARLDYQHAGRSSIINRSAAVNVTIGKRDLLNAQLGLDFGQYEVAVFATNLTDMKTPILPGPLGIFRENLEPVPRIVGARFGARF